MAEYREVRKDVDFLELCHSPDLAAKVTLDAARILDVDAAILFSDILVPAEAMGADVAFIEKGPTIRTPFREPSDVQRLKVPDPDKDLPFVAQAISKIRAGLPAEKALIGFAGAPFTVASYLVEGGGTRDFVHTKGFLYRHPEAFVAMLDCIAEGTLRCLRAQVAAGCQALQLFDSWAGFLAPEDYERFALPPTRKILDALRGDGVPTMLYANGSGGLLHLMATSGATCISVDWRTDLDAAWKIIGEDRVIQGNLDPIVLHGPEAMVRERTRAILDRVGGRPGFIFNLGHGIQKTTPVDNVMALVDEVKQWQSAAAEA